MEWKKINDKYKVSEYGEIYCFSGIRKTSYQPFIVKQRLQYGYLVCWIGNHNKQKKQLIHRLVYSQFIGEIPVNCDIHHKDGNRLNNHFSNLEPIDHSLHAKLHWDKREKIVKERVIKDKTKNKTYDMVAYQKKYREMRLKFNN